MCISEYDKRRASAVVESTTGQAAETRRSGGASRRECREGRASDIRQRWGTSARMDTRPVQGEGQPNSKTATRTTRTTMADARDGAARKRTASWKRGWRIGSTRDSPLPPDRSIVLSPTAAPASLDRLLQPAPFACLPLVLPAVHLSVSARDQLAVCSTPALRSWQPRSSGHTRRRIARHPIPRSSPTRRCSTASSRLAPSAHPYQTVYALQPNRDYPMLVHFSGVKIPSPPAVSLAIGQSLRPTYGSSRIRHDHSASLRGGHKGNEVVA
ncbi:hypothetical protein C8Q77DRAFT_535947 [Trametes polyzona]|nr:hypothetical protein C8Q77DRAFT_535947 [Trametes polyzona]